MPENMESILKNGFNVWKKNLNICVPIILNIVAIMVLVIAMVTATVVPVLGPLMSLSPEELTPELLLGQMGPMMGIIALASIVFIILVGLTNAFFSAGAIGMAKKANEGKSSTLSNMVEQGKKSAISVFLADIIVGLITLMGIVFVIPGILYAPIDVLLSDPLSDLLFAGGIFAFVLYVVIVSIVFIAVKYAIVIDNIGTIEGVKKGVGFFWGNKLGVLMIWIVIMVISLGLGIISQIMGMIPYMAFIWSIIQTILSIVVVAPLTIVWWARLYMDRTKKKIADATT